MEIIFKNNLDSILKMREEISSSSETVHYYDSGCIYILNDEGKLKFACNSLQEFTFQMVDYFLDMKERRTISDNDNYNLVLELDGEKIKMKEEWIEANFYKELSVNALTLKDIVLNLYKLINKELEVYIPDIVKSHQFDQHVEKLNQVLKS